MIRIGTFQVITGKKVFEEIEPVGQRIGTQTPLDGRYDGSQPAKKFFPPGGIIQFPAAAARTFLIVSADFRRFGSRAAADPDFPGTMNANQNPIMPAHFRTGAGTIFIDIVPPAAAIKTFLQRIFIRRSIGFMGANLDPSSAGSTFDDT